MKLWSHFFYFVLMFSHGVEARPIGKPLFFGVLKSFDAKVVEVESNGHRYRLDRNLLPGDLQAGKEVRIPLTKKQLEELRPEN